MTWHPFERGATQGARGSESGLVVRDDEHALGARITLETDPPAAPFAITCGIYGWMMHTRFFSSEGEAQAEFEGMKEELARILELVPSVDDPNVDDKARMVEASIMEFVAKHP